MRSLRSPTHVRQSAIRARRGDAALEYALVLAFFVVPILIFAMDKTRDGIKLIFEFSATTIAWPFM
jgi:Flp pilus assembly pilin Flp